MEKQGHGPTGQDMAIAVLVPTQGRGRIDGFVLPGTIRRYTPHEFIQRPYPVNVTRVRGQTREDMRDLVRELKRTLAPRRFERIIGYFQVAEAMKRNDLFTAASRAAEVAAKLGLPRATQITVRNISALVNREQNENLKGAWFVVWVRSDRTKSRVFDLGSGVTRRSSVSLNPGVLCKDLATAAFVHEALGYLRICPCCSSAFKPDRPDQHYCSTRCRETFNKRRSRARSKANKGGD